MLSIEETKKIAELSRIELHSSELEEFSKKLSLVIDYVAELQTVPTEGVEPLANVTGLENITRPDSPEECLYTEAILNNAPEIKDGYYKVKAIL